MKSRASFDADDAFIGSQSAQCPNKWCGDERQIKDLKPDYQDRAGLSIVHCTCRVCGQGWTRVVSKVLEAA